MEKGASIQSKKQQQTHAYTYTHTHTARNLHYQAIVQASNAAVAIEKKRERTYVKS